MLFAKELEVPFENNLAERGIRVFKSKLKSCCSFRSRQSTMGYSHFQSIYDTARKNGINIVDALLAIKNGDKNIFKFLGLKRLKNLIVLASFVMPIRFFY